MPSLFDPLAVATMVTPDLCTWRRGAVSVELQGQRTYGFTTFKAQDDGPHNVAWDVGRDRAIGWYLDRILGYAGCPA
jgi:inosine-uridine nucleoside N-ribohydrolase